MNSTEATLPEFLTVEETAALLRLAPKSVYDLISRGEVPGASKIGGAVRVHRPTLVASLSGQKSAQRSRRRR